MAELFDVVVIGAGPAGLNATLHMVKGSQKPKTLLVDKQKSWEKPIACAEGVWVEPFEQAVDVKKEWIRLVISNIILHSPDGSAVSYYDKNKGYIINRARMQGDMAKECESLGAVTWFDKKVCDVEYNATGTRTVRFTDGTTVIAKLVIDASGPICGFGKKENILHKPVDLEPALFVVAENTGAATDAIHIYLGKEIAPNGYAWLFPRDDGTANIGIVIGKAFRGKVNLTQLLSLFIKKNFPHARIIHQYAGTIPCEGNINNPIAIPGFMKAGDSAGTVNPVTRAGITEALTSGGLAGEFALAMLAQENENVVTTLCKDYELAWQNYTGIKHQKLSKVKNSFVKIPDTDYNKAFATLSKIPQEKLSVSKIIKVSLRRFPRLIFSMRHLM